MTSVHYRFCWYSAFFPAMVHTMREESEWLLDLATFHRRFHDLNIILYYMRFITDLCQVNAHLMLLVCVDYFQLCRSQVTIGKVS